MFTGLVSEIGTVEAVDVTEGGARLRIATPLGAEIAGGDSVAVAGACLTAAETGKKAFEADVMQQTLSLTTLGSLVAGDPVNLELALRASDRLGGHIVQGHIDGVAAVVSSDADGIARRLTLTAPDELMALVAERGSVAVDGVSLTVSGVGKDGFEVSLIPETLERTTLGGLREGDRANLEVDVMARYVQRLNQSMPRSSEGK